MSTTMRAPTSTLFKEASLYEGELTARQRQVLDLLAAGLTNAQIGDRLGISADGAKWHVSEILTKLALSGREEAAAYWRYRNSFSVRVRRVAAGLIGMQTLKWAGAAAAAAAVGAIAVIAVVAAMGGSEGEPVPGDDDPDATATTSPTQAPLPCPVDAAACNFARTVDGWLESGNSAALAAASLPVTYPCFGPGAQGAGQNLPLCQDVPAGETREGFVVSVAASDQIDMFGAEDWQDALDDFLAGVPPANVTLADAPRVSGIICTAAAPDCSGAFVVVTNLARAGDSPAGQPFYQGVALFVDQRDGAFGVTGLMYNGAAFESTDPVSDAAAVTTLLFPGGAGPTTGSYYTLPAE